MSDKTGGPAFPTSNRIIQDDGMTLRDYFAAKAMHGQLSNIDWMKHMSEQFPEMAGVDCVAQAAYEMADAMLEARK